MRLLVAVGYFMLCLYWSSGICRKMAQAIWPSVMAEVLEEKKRRLLRGRKRRKNQKKTETLKKAILFKKSEWS